MTTDDLTQEVIRLQAEIAEAHEALPDTIGDPASDSLARRIELLVRQSEDRIFELEAEVTQWRIASKSFVSSERDPAIKREAETQRAAAEMKRLVQQLDELRGVEAVREELLRQRSHLLDAIKALAEAVDA